MVTLSSSCDQSVVHRLAPAGIIAVRNRERGARLLASCEERRGRGALLANAPKRVAPGGPAYLPPSVVQAKLIFNSRRDRRHWNRDGDPKRDLRPAALATAAATWQYGTSVDRCLAAVSPSDGPRRRTCRTKEGGLKRNSGLPCPHCRIAVNNVADENLQKKIYFLNKSSPQSICDRSASLRMVFPCVGLGVAVVLWVGVGVKVRLSRQFSCLVSALSTNPQQHAVLPHAHRAQSMAAGVICWLRL